MQLDYLLRLEGKKIRFRIFSQEKVPLKYCIFTTDHVSINADSAPSLHHGELYLRGAVREGDNCEEVMTCTDLGYAKTVFAEFSEALRSFVLWHGGKKHKLTSSNVLD